MTEESSRPSGVCRRCGAEGVVGVRCGNGECAQQWLRYIPQTYASRSNADDWLVGRLVDGYLVVGVLGSGGMGTVRLAIDPKIGLEVALKTLFIPQAWRPHEAKLRERFLDEAKALARVNHPNVVRIHRYGEVANVPYMAMEFVEGGRTLADEIDKRIAAGYWFGRSEVLRIMEELLAGLSAVHAAGVVHRDVKPENVMLQPAAGRSDIVRLVDFGVAALFGTGKRDVDLAGTPEYMAPEQFLGETPGPWTDLYACGAMAYEMLTDKRPFPFDGPDAIARVKVDPDYIPTSQLIGQGYPPELLAFFAKALAFDARERYLDAASFRAGLADAIHAFAVLAVMSRGTAQTSAASDAAFQNWLHREKQRLEGERLELERKTRRATGKHAASREHRPTPVAGDDDR